jgi:hypothetical protein
MRRRWLAGIFAFCASWAVLVAVFSNDGVHQLWGRMSAVGYGVALLAVFAVRHKRMADIAIWAAFLGALVIPLAWMASKGLPYLGGLYQPEVKVVAESGWSLIHHGTPYSAATTYAKDTHQYDYNPYLPVMALFGLPWALFGNGLLTDPRLWFGAVFLVVFWYALRRAGARDPWRWTVLVAATPVIAFELAVGGTDVPMVAFLCLGFAFLWQTGLDGAVRSALAASDGEPGTPEIAAAPMLAGLALGIGASMKATAWPALLVAAVLLGVRNGRRAVGRFALAVLATIVVCVGPFAITRPRTLWSNTIDFPLGLTKSVSPAASPLPGHLIAHYWPGGGHTLVVALLGLAGVAIALAFVFRPPRTVTWGVLALAGAMSLMFVLAPATRFGYFIYPAALAIWVLAVHYGGQDEEELPVTPDPGALPAKTSTTPPTTPAARPAAGQSELSRRNTTAALAAEGSAASARWTRGRPALSGSRRRARLPGPPGTPLLPPCGQPGCPRPPLPGRAWSTRRPAPRPGCRTRPARRPRCTRCPRRRRGARRRTGCPGR